MNWKEKYKVIELIYDNDLQCEEDIKGFQLEGQASITFPNGRLRMENRMSAEEEQKSNFVYWCLEDFPDNIMVTWKFVKKVRKRK